MAIVFGDGRKFKNGKITYLVSENIIRGFGECFANDIWN